MPLNPQLRAIVEAQSLAGMPPFCEMRPAKARALLAAMQEKAPTRPSPPIGRVEDISLDGPAGLLWVRRYSPLEMPPPGRIVYFHGGGWVVGTLSSCDPICRMLAYTSGCEVWSVDYRLAPEAPFPAAIDDGWTALGAATSLDRLPLIVAGDSAGGNIAAVLALRAREDDSIRLAGQILFYPVTDHDLDRVSYRRHGSAGLILTRADMEWFWSHYISEPAERSHHFASPLRADDHNNLPPAYICVAGYDPLHDEGVAYARALAAAGVPVSLRDYTDAVHGFCSFVGLVDVADTAVRETGRWARTRASEGGNAI